MDCGIGPAWWWMELLLPLIHPIPDCCITLAMFMTTEIGMAENYYFVLEFKIIILNYKRLWVTAKGDPLYIYMCVYTTLVFNHYLYNISGKHCMLMVKGCMKPFMFLYFICFPMKISFRDLNLQGAASILFHVRPWRPGEWRAGREPFFTILFSNYLLLLGIIL